VSKFDRVNVAVLGGCCVGVIQRRGALGAEGDVIACAACGGRAVFRGGVWARS
jgi:hypothetical protein